MYVLIRQRKKLQQILTLKYYNYKNVVAPYFAIVLRKTLNGGGGGGLTQKFNIFFSCELFLVFFWRPSSGAQSAHPFLQVLTTKLSDRGALGSVLLQNDYSYKDYYIIYIRSARCSRIFQFSPNAKMCKSLIDYYGRLPLPDCLSMLHYIWIDGTGAAMRSKDIIIHIHPRCLQGKCK